MAGVGMPCAEGMRRGRGMDMVCFTDEELILLSDGILALVANAEEASRLVKDKGIQAMLSQKMQEYSDLEAKVCMMMGKV